MKSRLFTAVTAIAAAALVTASLAACTSAASTSAAKPVQDPKEITLVHIPSEEQTSLTPAESLVQKVLEKELKKKVKYVTATSYAATIEAQRAGKAQIAGYGPFSYAVAKDGGADITLLGNLAPTKGGSNAYHSVASVRAGSDIKTLADAKGHKVCFVDPVSTSGYLFPTYALMKAGLDPKKDITPVMAGGHDASVLALASKQCDVAFSTESMATKTLIESGQIKQGQLTQIWKSDLIPGSPVAVSNKISPKLKQQITDVYLKDLNQDWLKANNLCDTSDKNGLCGLGGWGYVPAKDSDYDPIRDVCDLTKADACTNVG